MIKRLFDLFFSILGLIVLSPILLMIAIWVKWDSEGPVFFRQERVGQFGKTFYIHKFRTMIVNAEKYGMQITVSNDSRITRSGFILRRYKLDELPQLIDVFLGRMSFVGPRPEVPKYVNYYPSSLKEIVLSVKPGITDLASIEFYDENKLLGQSSDPEKTYKEKILPIKLQYCVDYVNKKNLWHDVLIILKTLKVISR
ncbi:sugar transferase [uncultured Thiothrix sp.]|uniref:sugar transferase n=1 Tax=uncultured Thiothrix sp. TaxID=223185 RepID=UPI002635D5AC|nr:sugar transferase [uncultured Thiothrix sp.]